MAKREFKLTGSFDSLLETLHKEILGGSISATFQDGSNFTAGDVRCAVRVYERHSIIGNTRLGANLTLLGVGDELSLSIISAGGSGAIFFKVNTWGEEAFTDEISGIVNRWKKQNDQTRSTQVSHDQTYSDQTNHSQTDPNQTDRKQSDYDQNRRDQTDSDQTSRNQTAHDQTGNRFGIFGRKQKRDDLDEDIFGRK